jgi:phosphate transport system substrate-binding protein
MKRILILIALSLVVSSALTTPVGALAGPTIVGSGSTFAQAAIDLWRAEVNRKPYQLNVNYIPQGSSFGRQQFIDGAVDFAATDSPMSAGELAQLATSSRDTVYVPVTAGAIGLMYHVRNAQGQLLTGLNLTRRAVCRIFSEPDMRWNDPEIQAANPQLTLPDAFITPLLRSDEAGASFALSEFCIAVASDVWQAFVESRSAVDPSFDPEFVTGRPTSFWPLGWGRSRSALGSAGVAASVAASTGVFSITYTDVASARTRGFPTANVQNASGTFVAADDRGVERALESARSLPDGRFEPDVSVVDPAAYLPFTSTYVIAPTSGVAPETGRVLAEFLCYAVTRGQRPVLTEALGYASLSTVIVTGALASITRIPGSTTDGTCASMPPPEISEFELGPWTAMVPLAAAGGVALVIRRRRASSSIAA